MNSFQCFQREPQKTQQLKEHARPEIPKRTQHRREHGGIQRRAKRRARDGVEAQLPVPDAQRKEKDGERENKAIDRVERVGEPDPRTPPQPQRAQQVVEQRERHTEQKRRGEQPELIVDRDLHAQMPSRRESSPPPRESPASS